MVFAYAFSSLPNYINWCMFTYQHQEKECPKVFSNVSYIYYHLIYMLAQSQILKKFVLCAICLTGVRTGTCGTTSTTVTPCSVNHWPTYKLTSNNFHFQKQTASLPPAPNAANTHMSTTVMLAMAVVVLWTFCRNNTEGCAGLQVNKIKVCKNLIWCLRGVTEVSNFKLNFTASIYMDLLNFY